MKLSQSLLCAALFSAMAAPSASAALDSIPSIKVDKLTITPAGRILMDGAVYTPGGDGLNAGVALPDPIKRHIPWLQKHQKELI